MSTGTGTGAGAGADGSEAPVEIRRYPNRRFYDRSRRQYVTLQDIEALVLGGRTVVVRDSKSGEDLTRQVLARILMERHPHKMELFPVGMFHSLLRANELATDLWRGYLRHSLAAMEAWQRTASPFGSPFPWVSALIPGLAPAAPPAGAGADADADAAGEAVARRLDELAERLRRLEASSGPEGGPESSTPDGGPALDRLEQRLGRLERRRGAGAKRDGGRKARG